MGVTRFLLATAFAALAVYGQDGAAAEIASVRHWSLGTSTRIAIQTSQEARYRVEALDNPHRVFLDVLDASFRLDGKRYQTIQVNDPLVKQIRIAQSQSAVVRVVVDLAGAADYEISHLSNPHRLMVEIRPAVAPIRTEAPPVVIPPPQPLPETAKLPPAPATITKPPAAPRPAKQMSDGSRNLTRVLGLKLSRVVLDAGHGGHDHGTTGVSGLREKDLVLDIAQRLGALLEQKLGTEVIYTRSDDTFVVLEERAAIANRSKADLFLSIHANSSPSPRGYGTETYYLNFTTSKDELEVAARENAGTTQSIHELQDLVRKIALREKVEESKEFAARVQSALYNVWARSGTPARNRGIKKAPFVVLIGAGMPSVLTEVGFLSNPREESQLKRPEYRQKVAEALLRGIRQYAETLSHIDLAQVH